MEEQNSPENATLIDLIERVLHGTASEEQQRELEARLLANAEERRVYLHYLNLHSALKRRFSFDVEEEIPTEIGDGQASTTASRGTKPRLLVWSLATVAAAAVVLAAAFYFQSPDAEQPIAEITGLSGSLEWTGDGGRVLGDLSIGTKLPGGNYRRYDAEFVVRVGVSRRVDGNNCGDLCPYLLRLRPEEAASQIRQSVGEREAATGQQAAAPLHAFCHARSSGDAV